ncbi:Gfo/Idh/MocA family oxidoreductase [Gammaproteobacteria bacterium]|nr:Gfo/Idh/MocA family oxidoreductase [Gammaproteobacteria bacterium]MDA8798634.1 Gfo/Idh/MocA family oxidoreductase [Gammaproteobacteria bacterium]MDC0919300.1 Gfo/Idh/MocA family oxidoreductase [Gammaproteobacteria bacterium]
MSFSMKVFGAGSIGNHLSNAARTLGWSVDMCDIDEAALIRAKEDIYPLRYGAWDEEINLFLVDEAPKKNYDLIFIGTPPDTHIKIALEAIKENPKAILIEKPLCGPDLEDLDNLVKTAAQRGIKLFTGYDHVVGKATSFVEENIQTISAGNIMTLDVEFREFWGGIFHAHPWLAGPWESYLGFWEKGGGSLGEHSHAVNLWQHFAKLLGAGRIIEVQALLDFVQTEKVNYDQVALLNFKTESGMIGRCVQDVVTEPPRKWARIQYEHGYIEWNCNKEPGIDLVSVKDQALPEEHVQFLKTRPDDFIQELKHIHSVVASSEEVDSPISIYKGAETMLVIAAAHLAHQKKCTVIIDYSQGFIPQALKII